MYAGLYYIFSHPFFFIQCLSGFYLLCFNQLLRFLTPFYTQSKMMTLTLAMPLMLWRRSWLSYWSMIWIEKVWLSTAKKQTSICLISVYTFVTSLPSETGFPFESKPLLTAFNNFLYEDIIFNICIMCVVNEVRRKGIIYSKTYFFSLFTLCLGIKSQSNKSRKKVVFAKVSNSF